MNEGPEPGQSVDLTRFLKLLRNRFEEGTHQNNVIGGNDTRKDEGCHRILQSQRYHQDVVRDHAACE